MACHPLLISNNPEYGTHLPAHVDFQYIDGTALDVLIAGRDLAHKGWILANHPLYGNFRPHQQPYRSLVMLPPGNKEAARDRQEPCGNLSFLEEALMLYQGPTRKSAPEDVPPHMRKDCARIDLELMRATLESLS